MPVLPRITGSISTLFGNIRIDLGICLAGLLSLYSSSTSAGFRLESLMQHFNRLDRVEATFEEHKELGILQHPLVLRGRLSYRAPDYIKKEVSEPHHSLFEIEGDQLRIVDDGVERLLSLDKHPAIRAFAEAYRALLAGDADTLSRHYHIRSAGSLSDWELCLTPRNDSVRRLIEHICLQGRQARIEQVETVRASGDSSRMTIYPEDE